MQGAAETQPPGQLGSETEAAAMYNLAQQDLWSWLWRTGQYNQPGHVHYVSDDNIVDQRIFTVAKLLVDMPS